MRKIFTTIALSLLLSLPALAFQNNQQPAPAGQPPAAGQQEAPQGQPAAPATKFSPPLNGFGLEDGTPVKLRLSRNLSSASDKKGDTVDFEVVEDVVVEGVVVIPRGGIAWATITEAQPKRRMGRGGKLDVNIDAARLRDGEKVPLRAVQENKGGGHVGAMTGAMVATGIVFFPAAPLFLFMHGKDINIPKGTEITAYVMGNVPLAKAKFMDVVDPPPAAQAPASFAAAMTTVNVSSTPASADVQVDGNFVGNTPSSLSLSAGEYTIKVTKKGYKPWEKKLTVSGGTSNVNAELEEEKN
jgi:hypothetical protein